MSTFPLVSVGLPTRNGEKYIAYMLASLASQTYPNIELVISNNKSTDGTLKIISLFSEKFSNIKIFSQKETLTATDNFNFVLRKATGKYFIWASDDDYFASSAISDLVNTLETDFSLAGACPRFLNIEGHSNLLTHRFPRLDKFSNQSITYNDFLELKITDHKANLFYSLFNISVLRKIGGLEPMVQLSGPDLFLVQTVLLDANIHYSQKPLFFKRIYSAYDVKHMSFVKKSLHGILNVILNMHDNFSYLKSCLRSHNSQYSKAKPKNLSFTEKLHFHLHRFSSIFQTFCMIVLSNSDTISKIRDNDPYYQNT